MLNTSTQTQFAEATADLFDWYARTGTRLAWASADRGMSLWLGALQFAAKGADAHLNAWRSAVQPWMDLTASFGGATADGRSAEDAPQPLPSKSAEAAYATSYRTSSGHAAAYVTLPGSRI